MAEGRMYLRMKYSLVFGALSFQFGFGIRGTW